MTSFDYAFLGLLLVSAAVGAWRGFVMEIISIVAWVAAFVAGWAYAGRAGLLLSDVIEQQMWQPVAGFVLIFIAVLLIASLVRFFVRKLLKAAGVTSLDRCFGVVFGLARGVLIALVLVLAGGLLDLSKEPWWEKAKFAPPLETAVLALTPWLPGTLAEKISYR